MLSNIYLKNFALISQAQLNVQAGFTVLTGQTGAGKSILLQALSACLGERMDASVVRFGCDKAEVQCTFELDTQEQSLMAHLSEQEWQNDEQTTELVLRRVILKEGRSKAWVNGHPVSISELKTIGQWLVNFCGQHSQQLLLAPNFAKNYLDQQAGLTALAQSVKQQYHTWLQLHQKALQHQQQSKQQQQQYQYLQEAILEFEPLKDISYSQLEQQFDQQSNYQKLIQDIDASVNTLETTEPSLLSQLYNIQKSLDAHQSHTAQVVSANELIVLAQSNLQEALGYLKPLQQNLSFNADEFELNQENMALYHRLARKYQTQPQQLNALYNNWLAQQAELDLFNNLEEIKKQILDAKNAYLQQAQQLEAKRQDAAAYWAQQLKNAVAPLALPDAQFKFEFAAHKQPQADGLSQIELLFSANVGMPLQPVQKVASGGELSRITLVLQVLATQPQTGKLMVFDEVDVGISGGTAEVVGRMLKNLSASQQILCVTHQPQVAAFGDVHLYVQKQQGEQATSQVVELSEAERIEELARLSGGVDITEQTLAHAQSLRALGQG